MTLLSYCSLCPNLYRSSKETQFLFHLHEIAFKTEFPQRYNFPVRECLSRKLEGLILDSQDTFFIFGFGFLVFGFVFLKLATEIGDSLGLLSN